MKGKMDGAIVMWDIPLMICGSQIWEVTRESPLFHLSHIDVN